MYGVGSYSGCYTCELVSLHFQSSGDQGDDETASVAAGGSGDSAGASVREGSATSRTELSEVGI